jgi:hypothetical protein
MRVAAADIVRDVTTPRVRVRAGGSTVAADEPSHERTARAARDAFAPRARGRAT